MDPNNGRDGDSNWYDEIERLRIKLALALFLIVGILIHFTVVYVTEGGIHFFAFFEKTADAIIIAAVIGITYEWYASRSRHRHLRRDIGNIVQEETDRLIAKVEAIQGTVKDLAEEDLRGDIKDIIEEEHDRLIAEVNVIQQTVKALAGEETATFDLVTPSQAEQKLRDEIEDCNTIWCMGDFRNSNGRSELESFMEDHIERFIYERIKHQDEEFFFYRILPHEDGDSNWVDKHKPLFEEIDDEDSHEYHLLPHPHSADYPLPSFMIVDDRDTARGDLLILAIPEEEKQFEEFQKRLLLCTDDETVIRAFEDYIKDIWKPSGCIESAEDLLAHT